MKKLPFILVVILLAAGTALAQQPVTLENVPPVVVATSPRAGEAKVDPKLGEISVTFSKDMLTKRMWSFVQISPQSFPQTDGEPKYLSDKRTCVLPVRLEPGRTYALWLNYGQHNAFRDTGQQPALPYLLVFKTAP